MTSISNRSLFFKRFKPFLITFFSIEFILRCALYYRERAEIPEGMGAVALSFAVGVLYDAAVTAYLAAPFLLFLACAEWYSKLDRALTTFAYVFAVCFSMILAFADWTCWDDIGTRISYVAWDYLEYPVEVAQMVMAAYHGGAIIVAVLLGVPLVGYFVYPRILQNVSQQPTQSSRRAALLFSIILPIASFTIAEDKLGQLFINEHLNEISRNGAYQVASAFWRFHMQHDRYFLISDDEESAEKEIVVAEEEQDYNVIVVLMESMSADYMQTFGNKQNLTPNLDKLAQESLLFMNHYACGTRTVRGVEAVSMGLPPVAGPSRLKKQGRGKSIGSLFAERSYDTRFFYNGYGRFDNMGPFLAERGFTITDRSAYSPEEIEFENLWGVSDEDLYRKIVREADSAHEKGERFFHLVMTVSNHSPFTYPDQHVPVPSGTSRDGAVQYSDYAVGRFIEEAKKHDWFDSTIFVFTADHAAFSSGDREVTMKKYKIPLIFYAPKLFSPEKRYALASQMDIAPTVAGILNWNYTSPFYGRDLLRDDNECAFIGNHDHLCLARDGVLTILRPDKAASAFAFDGTPLKEVPENHLQEAIRIYQKTARL